MGVPTLTMVGPTLPGYVTASILAHAGLADFIAYSEDEFLQKGRQAAEDTSLLSGLRMQMRERMASSASGQPALIANGLETALRTMWRRWCAGDPPMSFEADATAGLAEPADQQP